MKNKWLHFSVDKETLFALVCGLLMILLSVAMMWLDGEVASIILRDALMIVLLGFFTPLYYIVVVKKQSLSVLGLHKNRLAASLAINVGAGGAKPCIIKTYDVVAAEPLVRRNAPLVAVNPYRVAALPVAFLQARHGERRKPRNPRALADGQNPRRAHRNVFFLEFQH